MQLDYKKLNDIKNQGRADCTPLKFNNPGGSGIQAMVLRPLPGFDSDKQTNVGFLCDRQK